MSFEIADYFQRSFPALTGRHPFPWQWELFRELCDGVPPEEVSLPTGCGKTSVMALWLLALCYQAVTKPGKVSLSRRLIWVVNRRVVVDQATQEAKELRNRISDLSIAELDRLRAGLRSLTVDGADAVLGISTLRGQFADNGEWSERPERAAIVIGTIDMIGSRLLFSGYGRGFKHRPLHAGFTGQDVLLVHDEAHLEPAFQCLIEAVRNEQERCSEYRRFRMMALTATARGTSGKSFRLTEADRRDLVIQQRTHAKKKLRLHPVSSDKEGTVRILERALNYKDSNQAILLFLKRVEDVREVRDALRKHGLVTGELTGTIRGLERDRMAKTDPVFARFAAGSEAAPAAGTVYLVCTSAGEVGVNMSADHLISDLAPLDSTIQRLGRVNRFGGGDATVEIVYDAQFGHGTKKSSPDDLKLIEALRRTVDLLHSLPRDAGGSFDASPAALEELPEGKRREAFTPEPEILPTSDILFDAWALTSIRGSLPGRPEVAPFLHGVSDSWEAPQTYVAWREEVERVEGPLLGEYPPQELLDDYPLKPQELIRDSTKRVLDNLRKLEKRWPGRPIWVVHPDGETGVESASDLAKRELEDLRDCMILLPPSAGGLTKEGTFDGSAEWREGLEYDVADEWLGLNGEPLRLRVWEAEDVPDGMRIVRRLKFAKDDAVEEGESSEAEVWLWCERSTGSRTARKAQDLNQHLALAEAFASQLIDQLGVSGVEATAIAFAARSHDWGKRRESWQKSIGNSAYPEKMLAKSGPGAKFRHIGYRHELGSMIDVAASDEFQRLNLDERELVLHLIGAHHGRCRPHFAPDEVFDPERVSELWSEQADEAPRRFGRLQRKYGRWGLAYLESLVRTADILASQDGGAAGAAAGGAQ